MLLISMFRWKLNQKFHRKEKLQENSNYSKIQDNTGVGGAYQRTLNCNEEHARKRDWYRTLDSCCPVFIYICFFSFLQSVSYYTHIQQAVLAVRYNDTHTHTHWPTQESNIMHQLTCHQPLSFSPALWVAGPVCSEDREPVAIKQMHHLNPQSSFHQRGNIYERLIALWNLFSWLIGSWKFYEEVWHFP